MIKGVPGEGPKAEEKIEGLVNGLNITWTSAPVFRVHILCATVDTYDMNNLC